MEAYKRRASILLFDHRLERYVEKLHEFRNRVLFIVDGMEGASNLGPVPRYVIERDHGDMGLSKGNTRQVLLQMT